MNYIYDIYVNLNETLYDFYEWNKSDNLIHIKKIPTFIIDSDTLKCITANKIKISLNFLKKIDGKTEVWSSSFKLSYCALFSDYNDIIIIQFDNDGNSIKKSVLYVDEESEILEDIKKTNIYSISFELIEKSQLMLKTRKQIKSDSFINRELKNIDEKKLNYICYECLGTSNNNSKENIKKLKKLKYTSSTYKNLYDILKLTSKATK